MGVLAIFSTGSYAIIGTVYVESETCYEKGWWERVGGGEGNHPCYKTCVPEVKKDQVLGYIVPYLIFLHKLRR